MGGPSEREYKEKLGKIREKVSKHINDIRSDVSKIEKIRVEALKKTEEIRRSTDKEINRMAEDIVKSKDLAPESKQRLHSEIAIVKNEIENNCIKLRRHVAETVVPAVA